MTALVGLAALLLIFLAAIVIGRVQAADANIEADIARAQSLPRDHVRVLQMPRGRR